MRPLVEQPREFSLQLGDLRLHRARLLRVRLAQPLDLAGGGAPRSRASSCRSVPAVATSGLAGVLGGQRAQQLLALLARLGRDDLLDLRLDRVVALGAEGARRSARRAPRRPPRACRPSSRSSSPSPALELAAHVVDVGRGALAVEHAGADLDRLARPSRPRACRPRRRSRTSCAARGVGDRRAARSRGGRRSRARTRRRRRRSSNGSCGLSDASMGTRQGSRGPGREADATIARALSPLTDRQRENRGRRRDGGFEARRGAGHAARDDGGLGDPPGARGRAQGRLPARGDRGPRARRLRGDRPRDGRRRQLQQRLGGARQAGLGLRLRRPPRVRPPHRRLRRLGDRLEGRRGRHPLEARRRGRDPLQPGLLRGRRGPRPRPDGGAEPGDLGLRDDLGLVRPVHQGPGPAAAAEAAQPLLGRVLGLRAHLLHRLPDADRPLQAPGRPQRADLGRRRRSRRVRDPALQGRRARTRSASSPPTRRASWSSSSARSTTSTATSSAR